MGRKSCAFGPVGARSRRDTRRVGVDPEPRVEGMYRIVHGRGIGFAEYGDPQGSPVFWFHGTPGGRRQVAPATRVAAGERGIRLIALERPGIGFSTPHLYRDVAGWADDVVRIADGLGIDRFACVGLSGGGPYVLACGARTADRMVAGAVLGGVAPTRGPDAIAGGLVGFANHFAPLLAVGHRPLGRTLHLTMRAIVPLRSLIFDAYIACQPEGDQRVFREPHVKEMFVDDIVRGMRANADAPVLDLVLFTRPWGFRLRDVQVPIRLWHGDADHIVPLGHGEHLAARLPDAELCVRPGESHLGGLGASDEIFDAILALWPSELAVATNAASAGP
jgi:pimeloyl-ACP methyl ester carboxylesterase